GPAQHADDEPEIARVADDAVDAAGDQGMPGLDGDQPAEAVAENEDRPQPQCAAGGEEHDAEPAHGVAVDGPKLLAVGVGRNVGIGDPDHGERDEAPAVPSILPLPRT